MDGGEPADFGQIGLGETEREAAPFAQPGRHQPRVGLAQEVRDPRNGVEPTEAKQPGTMDGGVEQGREPELAG